MCYGLAHLHLPKLLFLSTATVMIHILEPCVNSNICYTVNSPPCVSETEGCQKRKSDKGQFPHHDLS